MTKKNKKAHSNLVQNKPLDELLKNISRCGSDTSPDSVLKRLDDFVEGRKSWDDLSDNETNDLLVQAVAIGNLSNHMLVEHAVQRQMRASAVHLTNQIIQEYNCSTPSEIILAQSIAESFTRKMMLATAMTNNLDRNEYSDLTVLRQKAIGNDLDRAERHFLTALQTLQQVKSPAIEMKINAKNAFVGQNQQFNTNRDEKDKA